MYVKTNAKTCNIGARDMLLQQLCHYQDDPDKHLWTPHFAQFAFENASDNFICLAIYGSSEQSSRTTFLLYLEYLKLFGDLMASAQFHLQHFKQCCQQNNFQIHELQPITGFCLQETPFRRKMDEDHLLRCFCMLSVEFSERAFNLNRYILQCTALMASTILFNVSEEIKESDLVHMKVFLEYFKRIKKYGFQSILQDLVFIVHEFKGPKFGLNTDYLKSIISKFSTPETPYENLFTVFQDVVCYTLPSIKDCTHSRELPFEYIKAFCQFAHNHICASKTRRNLADWLTQERNSKFTFKTINRYMKGMNDGKRDLDKLLVEDTARHEYFNMLEAKIKDYANHIVESIKSMTVNANYQTIEANATEYVSRKYEDIHIDFRHLEWYETGRAAYKKFRDIYEDMYGADFRTKKADLTRIMANYKQLDRTDPQLSFQFEYHYPRPQLRNDPQTGREMDHVFVKAAKLYDSKMEEVDMFSKEEVLQQHSKAAEAAKQLIDAAADSKFPQTPWDQRTVIFNMETQEKKKEIIARVETMRSNENIMHTLHTNAMSCYRESMMKALNSIEEPFEEYHRKCLKNAKRILTSDKLWVHATYRKMMETKFAENTEKERLFFEPFFKLKQESDYFENEKKIASVYQNLMDDTVWKLGSTSAFNALHAKTASQAFQQLKLSKKHSKDVGTMLRESLNPYKKKYLEMFELHQEVQEAQKEVKVFDEQKLALRKAADCFIAPHKLLCRKDNLLCKGEFGCFRKAWNEMHGDVVVKQVTLNKTTTSAKLLLQALSDGASLFRTANHDHVIRVLGHTRWGNEFGAVLEHVTGMAILPFLQYTEKKDIWLPPVANLRLCADVASALHFLASDPLLTVGDITIHDVMVTLWIRAKVAGFKIGSFVHDGSDEECGCSTGALGKIMASVVLREEWKDDTDWDRISEESMACAETQEERQMCWALEDEIRMCHGGRTTIAGTRNRLLVRLESAEEPGSSDERSARLPEFLLDAMSESASPGAGGEASDKLIPIIEL